LSIAPLAPADLQRHTALAFATPVIAYPWPDRDAMNADLKKVILAAESRDGGVKRSNVGGWHSSLDFFAWDVPSIRDLRQRAEALSIALIRAMTIMPEGAQTIGLKFEAWANVSRSGGYNAVHDHPNCVWSGVYYVASGGPDPAVENNGKLELIDPRGGVGMIHIGPTLMQGRYLVDPLPGLMVMFPSWIKHWVHPFHGTGERISIAFNVGVREEPAGTKPARR
jgi:uncharacterized protein (TIGR02466 family)